MFPTVDPRRRVPNHRDLYLIIIGLVAGILLGPFVLGRVSPKLYDDVFLLGRPNADSLESVMATALERQKAMVESGASPVAAAELLEKVNADQQNRRRALMRDRLSWLRSRMTALVLAMILLMALETLTAPSSLVVHRQLISARYALIAIWLAIALAQPRLVSDVPGLFVALLVVVSLIVALIPLRKTT